MMQSKNLKFEGALEKLEGIVKNLENGEFSLEESLKAFEEGIAITRHCEKLLKTAKGKIEQLIQIENGSQKTVPFESNES